MRVRESAAWSVLVGLTLACSVAKAPASFEPPRLEPAVDASGDAHAAAARELEELGILLMTASMDPAWPHREMGLRDNPRSFEIANARHPGAVVAARLTLFASRYGVSARELPEWAVFEVVAREARRELERRDPGGTPAQTWERAFLAWATGDAEAACELIPDADATDSFYCCWMHDSELNYWSTACRAVMLDLVGERDEALRTYHEAFKWFRYDELWESFGYHRVAGDLVLARYAALLDEAGEHGRASTVRAELDGFLPDSLGLALARDAAR